MLESALELVFAVLGAVFWPLLFGVWLLRSWRKEKRRLRNGVLIVLFAWALWGLALRIIEAIPGIGADAAGLITLAIFLFIPFSVVALAVLLIANGVTMLRREARSLGNMLSLLAGVALIALPIAALVMVLTGHPLLILLAALAFFVCAYLGIVFASFLTFTLAYLRITPRTDAGAVVIHGSGLVEGEMPPLLRARVDRGLEEWERQRDAGNIALMIPSGGQGPDEPRPEATVMAEYLQPKLPVGVLTPETESRTTEENIEFSRDVMQRRGADEPMVLVTNNYHVPRAALLTQRIGVDADVIGAPTARYFLPSAYLREFVAVVSYHLRLHVILMAPVLIGTLLLTFVFALS